VNIHEFQAKSLLRQFGVAVPQGEVANTPQAAAAVAEALARGGASGFVVKAQIHAGGRGKGGGVKLANSAAEVPRIAAEILGMTLVTPQTGPGGRLVRRVLVEAATPIERELYLALTLDRGSEGFAIIASTEGGMDIEEVAARTPQAIHTQLVDPNLGLRPYQSRKLARALQLGAEQSQQFAALLGGLYRLFVERDASLIEINPLVLSGNGANAALLALDAKLGFDDNALFRQPQIAALRDAEEEDPRERRARESGLAYVGLDGNVGCMVNGAGLAMATLDMITACGGSPANFLDAGGTADRERVKQAFKLILQDEQVRAILINIFGGIVRCDLIAEGVTAAAAELGVGVPLVVRLQGAEARRGREILDRAGLPGLRSAETLRQAAELAVAAARGS